MQEIVLETLIYVIDNPVLTLVIAFIAGFLATKFVAADRRPGIIGFVIIGLIGSFLGHFVIIYFRWNESLDGLLALRIIIDLLAAFIGSFLIAGILHFLKPS